MTQTKETGGGVGGRSDGEEKNGWGGVAKQTCGSRVSFGVCGGGGGWNWQQANRKETFHFFLR